MFLRFPGLLHDRGGLQDARAPGLPTGRAVALGVLLLTRGTTASRKLKLLGTFASLAKNSANKKNQTTSEPNH